MSAADTRADALAGRLNAHALRRLHRHSWLFILGHLLWQNSLALVMAVVVNRELLGGWWLWIALAAGVLTLFAMVDFLTYRFVIRDGDIVIRHGIFWRKTRFVPLGKVHTVTLRRNVLHRALGVAEVLLETGGSGQAAEAHLRVLSLDDARAFEELLSGGATPPDEDAPQGQVAENLLPLGRGELLRYGLISNHGVLWGGALLPFIWSEEAVLEWMKAQIWRGMLDSVWARGWGEGSAVGVLLAASVVLGLLAIVVAGKLATVLLAFVRYGNFQLHDSATHITVRRGLFTRVESHVPKSRIQAWRVQENPFHRCFARCTVRIDSIVMPGDTLRGIRELIPIAPPEVARRLLLRWGGVDPLVQVLNPLHPLAARRLSRRYGLWVSAAVLLAGAFAMMLWDGARGILWGGLALLWLLLLYGCRVAAAKRCAHAGWALAEGFLHWRDGWLWRKHHYAPLEHIRALRLSHNPFDRHYAMAQADADTTGSTTLTAPLRLRYLPEGDARALLQQCQAEMDGR